LRLRGFLLLGVFAAVLLAGNALPAPAGAAKCLTCESEGEGEVEAQFLTIEIVGRGSVGNGTKTYCENTTTGTKSCEVELAEGKKVTLTAAGGFEYVFQSWSGACSGSGSCEVTMTGPKSVTATFSNPPPAAPTITSPTSGQVFERTAEEPVSVTFSIGDPTVVAVTCSLDGLPAVSCSSGWSTPKLSSGEHTVHVTAKDGVGNATTANRSFEVVIGSLPLPDPKPGTTPGSGSSSGTPSATSTAPLLGTPLQKIAARLVAKSKLDGSATVFRKLALKALPTGAKVLATCKGKGCPFKRKLPKVKGGSVDLGALFAGRELGAGTLIEFTLSAPGMLGQTIDLKTRAGKPPKVTKR